MSFDLGLVLFVRECEPTDVTSVGTLLCYLWFPADKMRILSLVMKRAYIVRFVKYAIIEGDMGLNRIKRELCIALILAIIMAECGFSASASADLENMVFSRMLERAEAIVNYEWTPAQRMDVWNENPYNGRMYFEAGEIVIGMPYTLFTSEIVSDSLLSLAQYTEKADINYSTTTYCRSMGAERTGPVYGSCCATFVSEVLGGSFMSGRNPRFDSVTAIRNSGYGVVFYNVAIGDIQQGDALCLANSDHIIWVGEITDNTITIYEQTPPVARKQVIQKAESTNDQGFFVYNGKQYNVAFRSYDLLSARKVYTQTQIFGTPIFAYTLNTGKTLVYNDVNGVAKTNKIYDTDLCIIEEIYDNGWCFVTFPLDLGGVDTGYIPTTTFFAGQDYEEKQVTSDGFLYIRSTMSEVLGQLHEQDVVRVLYTTDYAIQVLWIDENGDSFVGWINPDMLPEDMIPERITGDINGDEAVNSKDLTRLMKYLSGEDLFVVEESLDINGDGDINIKDLTRLMKYLAGEDVAIY